MFTDDRPRYSQEELEEFKQVILAKLETATASLEASKDVLSNAVGNDVADTSPTYKNLEEGALTLSKEEASIMAQRQLKFIQNLKAALVRIENGTYGICRISGKLIPKERLLAVPHATTRIEAKLQEKEGK